MAKRVNQINETGFQALGSLLIAVAYAPGVFRESFWSDDYPALVDTPGIVDHLLRDARPTSAGLISVSFSLLHSPQNGWVLRLIALFGLLFLFIVISRTVLPSKDSGIANFAIAVAFCIPTFQTYVHWSITWFYSWTALWGVIAFRCWRSHRRWYKVLGVLFLVLALTSYPPAALFFFAVIAVVGVLNHSGSRQILTELLHGLVLLVISIAPSALVIFLSMNFSHVSASKRVSLISIPDIPDKIVWLISRPLVVGLRPFLVDSPTPVWALITSLPLLLVLLIGLQRQSNRAGESIWLRESAVALPLILSLIPIAIVTDNQIEFRILPGYCWGVLSIAVFLLLLEIKKIVAKTKLRDTQTRYILLFVPVSLAFVAIFTINQHYSQLFGGPYQKKTKFLIDKISLCASTTAFDEVLIVPPKTPFPSLQRLGVFSTVTDLASEWVPKPSVQVLLKQHLLDASVTYLPIRPLKLPIKNGVCLIDLEEYKAVLK